LWFRDSQEEPECSKVAVWAARRRDRLPASWLYGSMSISTTPGVVFRAAVESDGEVEMEVSEALPIRSR
jgi:hypothetical protein